MVKDSIPNKYLEILQVELLVGQLTYLAFSYYIAEKRQNKEIKSKCKLLFSFPNSSLICPIFYLSNQILK